MRSEREGREPGGGSGGLLARGLCALVPRALRRLEAELGDRLARAPLDQMKDALRAWIARGRRERRGIFT